MVNLQKKILVSVSLLLVLLMLSGCNLFVKKNGLVTGIVTMGDGKSPLVADIYVAGEKVVKSGADGKFTLDLKPGTYEVQAEYSGVKSQKVSVKVLSGKTVELSEKLLIQGLGVFSGVVKTADGLALSGRKVKLGTVEAVTDAEGKYRMFVTSGKQQLTVEYKGYVYSKEFNMPEADHVENITLDKIKEITLTLKNSENKAIAGYLANIEVGAFKETVTSNAEGKIKFIGVAEEGQLEVKVDGIPDEITELKSEATATVNFATATEAVLDLSLPVFADEFNDLDNWEELEPFEYNQWLFTEIGAVIKDGALRKETKEPYSGAASSSVRLKDHVFGDAVVIIRTKANNEKGTANAGLRVHLRNNEDQFCYGYGVNLSATGYELANWNWGKTVAVGVSTGAAQYQDENWFTIAIVVKDHTLQYYREGILVAETTETDESKQHLQGSLVLAFTGSLELDNIRIYEL